MKVRWTPTAILVALLLALVGCGGGGSLVGFEDASVTIAFDASAGMDVNDDIELHRDGSNDFLESADLPDGPVNRDCVDNDGDHYGMGGGCTNADCDDSDPNVTDQCYCDRPEYARAGCNCRLGSDPLPCDLHTGLTRGADEVCFLGQRTCDPVADGSVAGQWSACRQWRPEYPSPTRFVGAVEQCPGDCSPQCRHQVICPETGDAIPPGSSNITVANEAHAVFCPGGAGIRGGVTTTCSSTTTSSYTRSASSLAWIDACAASGHTTVLANADDATTRLMLAFPFRFYGTSYASAGISANGLLTFASSTPSAWVNQSLPNGTVDSVIVPFWSDLRTRSTGVCVATTGVVGSRRYVIEWSDAQFRGDTGAHLNFEIVLSESSNTIDVLYQTMTSTVAGWNTGGNSTVGIQQGTGPTANQVGYNTAGSVAPNTGVRWVPNATTGSCTTGIYDRVYEGSGCTVPDAPYWGQFNFSALVPSGTQIRFQVRTAETMAGLASAPWSPLANATNSSTTTLTSLPLGPAIIAGGFAPVGADHFRFLELQATLVPSPDGSVAPTLISTEAQFTCAPAETSDCVSGGECFFSNPCIRGVINCTNSMGGRPVEHCEMGSMQPVGTTCDSMGTPGVCDATGACVPCAEGAACSTGHVCSTGHITCATGAPTCAMASQVAPGTICGGNPETYVRTRPSTVAWFDVCASAGHRTLLAGSDDGWVTDGIGFPFRYYNAPFTSVAINSNGLITFPSSTYVLPAGATTATSTSLPASVVENTVFAFWDNLAQRSTGICTNTIGSAPLRRYIVQWSDAGFSPLALTDHLNFEASFEEGSNAIDVIYNSMTGLGSRPTGANATVGIQRGRGADTADVDQVAFHSATATAQSIHWAPGTPNVCNAAGDCVPCLDGAPCTFPGVCALGVLNCSSGAPVCVSAGTRASAPEVCDGIDNDCDGVVDNGVAPQGCYSGTAGTQGVGVCRPGTQACVMGAWGACTGQVVPSTELCNNLDDDCDGTIDNGATQSCYTGAAGTSGVGVCRPGTQTCSAGTWGTCTGQVVPSTELCNNLDDDCNGTIDDSVTQGCYTGPTGTNGVGLCRPGSQSCSMGLWSVCTGQVTPVSEVCDNRDNDCNGLIDNGVSQTCYTGPAATRMVGRCRDGLQACYLGGWDLCTGQTLPGTETCNNIDDDCDGTVDDGVAESCYSGPAGTSGVGICHNGSRTCAGGVFGVVCPGEQTPLVEVCNGRDDDCDGMVDEGLGTTTCGSGPCARTVANCIGGVPQTCVPGGSGTETCNGLDDDCDGVIDNGVTQVCYTGPAGTNGVGVCRGGVSTCSLGTWGSCMGQVVPTAELCNSLDDNCEGHVDETFPTLGSSCTAGVGACRRTGTTICAPDGLSAQCSAVPSGAMPEVCNNIDDNCNGVIDEGLTQGCYGGPAGTVGVGTCHAGTQTCGAGAWSTCAGEVRPTLELCNNLDDDCNGTVDNVIPQSCYTGPAATRSIGTCRDGSQTCTAGSWNTCTGQTLPTTDICDGLDNNCNGTTDEPFLPPAMCASTPEVCDGLDNNCNGIVDDLPGLGTTCPARSCLAILRAGVSSANGIYRLDPDGAGPIVAYNAYCDMVTSGGGWTLIGRSRPGGFPSASVCVGTDGGSNFGWRSATGSVLDDTSPYSLNAFAVGPAFTEVLFGDYSSGKTWGANVYQRTLPSGFIASYPSSSFDLAFPPVPAGSNTCPSGSGWMFRYMGYTANTDTFHFRDNSDNGFGLTSSGWASCYGTGTSGSVACYSGGGVDTLPGQIMVRGQTSGADDGFLGNTCTVGAGACARTGVWVCRADGSGTQCSATPGSGVTETCNGIDDNCNGLIDEGVTQTCYSGPAGTRGVGRCAAGTQACSVGTWGTCIGEILPSTEICNALDDNCNGQVDEGLGTTSCGVGACARTVNNCMGGAVQTCMAGTSTPEVCDGVDNDCDGVIDNGAVTSCAMPQGSGTLGVGSTLTVNTFLPPAAGSEIWLSIAIPPGYSSPTHMQGAGSPRINLQPGDPTVQMEVRTSCGITSSCGPTTQWVFVDNASTGDPDGYRSRMLSTPWPDPAYIRLYRTAPVAMCSNIQIVATRPTCSSLSAEICDGLDNDCNGLVDEGFCRVGGVCFTNGQINPANSCQVCVTSSTASGATSWGFVAGGTVCRPSTGMCDPAESCAGTGAPCPADTFLTTVCRLSTGICDPAENCTGSSGACPVNTIFPAGTVCRSSTGVCDPAEICDGTTGACPADGMLSTVCRASTGVCDPAEVCAGTSGGCPADTFLPSSTVCRTSTGVCDLAESCTGSSGACPADTLQPSTTVCRASTGTCDPAETCTGTSGFCPGETFLSSATVCRTSTGVCDPAENCTGTSGACPANTFVSAAVVCRSSTGVCDVAENCTGTSGACPPDTFVSTVCRASTGVCDPQEVCTGTSGGCPADTFVPSSTVCRTTTGVCDPAENCTGSSGACPADTFVASSVICRTTTGVCDPQENCTGSSGACPMDTFVAAGTICRAATGVCDPSEACSGSSGACPIDVFVSTVCRASTGVCDPAELCGGSTGGCPADTFLPSSTVCRSVAGVCDVAESCTGSSGACPADTFTASTVVCRSVAGVCDVAESCTGTSAACPANAFTSSTTVCRSTTGVCDPAENCTGTSAACPTDTFLTTVCRSSTGVCDPSESCTGSSGACPADTFRPATTVCRASTNIEACDPSEYCTGASGACPGDIISRLPTPETCNNFDDDCDGIIDNGPTSSCASPTTLVTGVLNVGDILTASGYVPAPAGSEVWYRVSIPANYSSPTHMQGEGSPRIAVTGDPTIQMEVRTSCGTPSACGATTQWVFVDNASTTDPQGYRSRMASTPWPDPAYIRLYRTVGATTCSSFTVTATRPACSVLGAEVCDGIDNDCNGLVDEGFCRIGGVCYGINAPNPANNCEYCAATTATSGPTSWSPVMGGTVCRASTGVCDPAEACTGVIGATCPADTVQPATAVCRSSTGVCDPAENCTGTGGACPANTFAASTAVCRASSGVCDPQELCSGSSGTCPNDTFTASSVVCRTTTGVCDPAENCTGSAGVCPADTFVASTTVCRTSTGVCDPQELCTGSSGACPTDTFTGGVCRASTGVCDPAENCTGTAGVCPADTFSSSTTVCRSSSGVCDPQELCTGSSGACPTDTFVPSTTVCRTTTGVCDVAENCTGSSGACPADSFLSPATVCRTTTGVCDPLETCTGTSGACPANFFFPSTTVCRTAAGVCDPQEFCTGSSGACPADTFVGATTVCRASTGVCDPAENCGGTSGGCPADTFTASTVVCRSVAGVCDVSESCTGSSGACPADTFTTSTAVCRSVAGVCDVSESCTGTSAACPADTFTASTTVCRSATGVCDSAENCTGTSAACPADTFLSTVCRASTGVCDPAETCSGATGACPPDTFRPATTVCRSSANIEACDPTEYCTGSTGPCPGDVITRMPTPETCNNFDDDCDGIIDNGPTSSCGAPQTLAVGVLNVGDTLSASGYVPAPAGSEVWYRVSIPAGYSSPTHMQGQGSPRITVTGDPTIQMEVRTSCGTPSACGATNQWVFVDNASTTDPDGYRSRMASTPWPDPAYIRLYRTAGATTCSTFTVTATRPACSVLGVEVCDGIDNDCNGLVDEGFCRIGGVCYGANAANPANSCEYCAATTTMSGPTSWNPVAGGTVCRPSTGVCDPAEACTGVIGSTCPADVVQSSTAVCRASTGVCDPAETCTGTSGVCPADTFLSTVCRSSTGVCDPQELCTGSSGTCPADVLLPSTTVCRTTTGVCDPAENCTGSSGACPNDTFVASTTVCRTSTGVCDPAENCTGTSGACPANTFLSVVCRASTGVCDPQELCTGSSGACPGDTFTSSTTVCRTSTGVCDPQELCTGTSGACPNDTFTASSVICRTTTGVCDPAENCTGTSGACPNDTFVASSVTCRTSTGVCDPAENCTGTSGACPANTFLSTVCRTSTGVCDPQEVCSGSSGACPGDTFTSSTTVCRTTTGVCDPQELCTGTSGACPADTFVASSVICRTTTGVCDPQENCTGSSGACPSDTFLPSSTECRSSTGVCDPAENCTGTSGACPANLFLSVVCRASTGVCDPAETCSGSSGVCPNDTFTASSVICRTTTGVCDPQENCTGTSGACPADTFVASSVICRTTTGVCDPQENCTGTSGACPSNTFLPSSTECRSSTGVCDPAENCTGTSGACPANLFLSVVCRASTGVCDPQETCTGSSGACPNDTFTASSVICRTTTGVCDPQENCTGTSGACPSDTFLPSSTECRSTTGVCDPAENCTGTSGACPANAFVAAGTTCRSSTGVCDPAENCTGSSGACPGDTFTSSTTVCRATTGVCDPQELCTGSAGTCPSDTFTASSAICRTTTGVCDPQENCTGSSGACPADTFLPSSTECRSSTGVCDPAENCTGTSGACPANTFVSTVCRASTGVCDPAETCTGSAGSCPSDTFLPATTVCRSVAGVCDVAENCTGTSGACPADTFVASTAVCRSTTGVCDPQELCTGTSAACPANTFLASTTVCRTTTGVCDPQELCTGTSGACPTDTFLTTVCRSSTGVCDPSESCTGSSGACPADTFRPATTVCRASTNIEACDPSEYCTGSTGPCPGDTVTRLPTPETCNNFDDDCDGIIDNGPTSSCASPTTLVTGVLNVGDTLTVSGYVPAPAGSEVWYRVAIPAGYSTPTHMQGAGSPRIAVTGDPTLQMEVRTSCGTPSACGATNQWVFVDNASTTDPDGYRSRMASTPWPDPAYIRLYRTTGATTCSSFTVTATRPACSALSAEVCDGVDNDCNGLVDEGFCRIGGVCYGASALNPANNCEYCAATTTASGPTSWNPVAAGTTCRPTTGVCDPAETCTGVAGSSCPTDTILPSSTVCRSSTGVCDPQETCTGTSGACPTNTFQSSSTVCRSTTGVCDPQEFCTGSSGACPNDTLTSSTTVCRTSTGVCDPQEFCTGASGTCPGDTFVASSTVCRTSTGVCDPQEFCTGSSGACPGDTFLPAATECRATTGVCDPAESCTGTSGGCPANFFLPSTTVCRATTGVCDPQETCTGTSGACPNDAFLSTICRASTGVCDPAESCSGLTGLCPSDTFLPSSTLCRTSTGVCDPSESCTGASGACPNDTFLSSTTTCRTSTGVCDPAESCTGTSGACPNDAFLSSSTVCRLSTGVCDPQETCTGASGACPGDAVVPSSTVCRTSTGVCDPAENCTGAGGGCPTDTFLPSSTVCRTTTGVCDPQELCTGTSGACPANFFLPSSTVCRTTTGVCDPQEFCTGGAGACPNDTFTASTVVCRSSTGVCDPQEFCTGSAGACPNDVFTGGVCRASTGVCDPAESCTGTSGACPGDTFLPSSTVCRTSTGVCDPTEFCTGGSGACPGDALLPSTTVCRTSAGICDPQEFCTGGSGACPGDARSPSTTSCRVAAGVCDVTEFCDGSSVACPADTFVSSATVCRASTTPANTSCDPAEFCTGGSATCPANVIDTTRPATEVCDGVDNNCDGIIDNGPTTSCGTAINLGTMAAGGSVTRTDWIAGPAGSEQWYVVSFPINADFALHGTGTPQIALSSPTGAVRFDVRSDCSTNLACGSGGTASGLTSWVFVDNATSGALAYTSRSVAWPTTVYVRVYRVASTSTCANQTISFTR